MKSEDFTSEYEETIHAEKNHVIWTMYQQGKTFQKLKEKKKFVTMMSDFNITKSTMIKIKTSKQISKIEEFVTCSVF